MPRGENPNSRANLAKGRKFDGESARKANKKSHETKVAYKSLTEALKAQCTPEVMAQLTDVLVKRAKQGNLKAYELVRDQLGEKPAEKIQVAQVKTETVAEIEDLINGVDSASPKGN